MSQHKSPSEAPSKVTAPGLVARKLAGEKITAVTAYDAITASIADAAGIDFLLVGDSLANTALGYENTLPVSMDEMLVAVRAVSRAARRALLVADMPFGSYQVSAEEAVGNAVRFIQAGAHSVKLEGGRVRCPLVRRMAENGIPVIGHIGLTPQSLHAMGGYKVQGRLRDAADRLLSDAVELEAAGVSALVLEGIPSALGERITAQLEVPTIGIGAGPACDGQILVISDLLGLNEGRPPKFVRQYARLREEAIHAVHQYAADVRSGEFPAGREGYSSPEPDAAAPIQHAPTETHQA